MKLLDYFNQAKGWDFERYYILTRFGQIKSLACEKLIPCLHLQGSCEKLLSLVCPSEFGNHLTHSAVPRNPGEALLRYPTQGCPLGGRVGDKEGFGELCREAGRELEGRDEERQTVEGRMAAESGLEGT